MFLSKKYKHSFFKPQFLPASFFMSILSVLFFCTTTTVFAASAPPYLTLSISTPTVNFQFNQAENAASAFKEDMAVVQYDTDNETGFTAYVSSIDEDTSLNHVDPSVTQKITSITTPGGAATFGSKNWGYLANQTTASTTSFNPIPKASQPDQALNISHPEQAKFFLHFGVKTGPDLPAGTYSKKILVTAITNYVPTSATFLPGRTIYDTIQANYSTNNIQYFKKSLTAPAPSASAKIVSTADSEKPIYLWYDNISKTLFWWSDADTVYANENSSFMMYGLNSLHDVELVDMRGINTSRVKNMISMFGTERKLIKHINLDEFDTSNVEYMNYMFAAQAAELNPVVVDPLDLSHFDTSKVKSMQGMFKGTHYSSIDISNFNTSSVTNMEEMFEAMAYTTSLNLSGLNVRNVANINRLFKDSNSLVSINLSGWQLDSINNMSSMFSQLHALNNLNLSGFTTKNVTDMHHMFNECHALTDLDLSSFDTSKVTDMNNMFRDNFALKNLNISSFNTSNVTNMSEMFRHSGVIYPLDVSSFDTRKVTDMTNMFYWTLMAPENGTLDLSNFDTRSLTTAAGMFNYTKAKTIYVSDQFTTAHLSPNPIEMFMTNTNLTGGNGTQYAYPNNSSQYARIDAPGNPGYFTRKP